jgi:adenylate cyclase, class 2
MIYEIEYKFALIDTVDNFTEKLKSLGYEIGERNFEKTVMYDNAEQLMQISDGRIRLRISGNKSSLSYKKPLPSKSGEPKKEIEYETVVDSFEVTALILETMNYHVTSQYEKYRTKIMDGAVQITIDEYPYQTFVEIEGGESHIKDIATKLGFELNDHINLPADTLFNIWRSQKGLKESMNMTFDDYNK